MKIYICGDSFMATDPSAPGQHFSELLHHRVTNLAYPGVGNIDICFQIEKSIQDGADYVIIGTTDSARIEISTKPVAKPTLKNFRDGSYISRTIPTFIGEELDLINSVDVSNGIREAAKMYFAYLYDQGLKNLTDNWSIEYWCTKLKENNIKYQILPKSFCIYQAARNCCVPWTFHTEFVTQQEAADILNKELQ